MQIKYKFYPKSNNHLLYFVVYIFQYLYTKDLSTYLHLVSLRKPNTLKI